MYEFDPIFNEVAFQHIDRNKNKLEKESAANMMSARFVEIRRKQKTTTVQGEKAATADDMSTSLLFRSEISGPGPGGRLPWKCFSAPTHLIQWLNSAGAC